MAADSLSAWFCSVVLVAMLPLGAVAQGAEAGTGVTPVPSSVTEELRSMAEAAGVIFSGTVVGVKRVQQDGAGPGVVEVRFAVEHAVQGCSAGGFYTLREWAGLWAGGVERYRVGQRLLMLLRPPGAGGLTSPVGGQDGVMPLLPAAADAGGSAAASTGGASTATEVDLRWISARVRRPVSYRSATRADAGAGRPLQVVTGRTWDGEIAEGPQSVSVPVRAGDATPSMVQRAPAAALLAMLQAWKRESRGAQ